MKKYTVLCIALVFVSTCSFVSYLKSNIEVGPEPDSLKVAHEATPGPDLFRLSTHEVGSESTYGLQTYKQFAVEAGPSPTLFLPPFGEDSVEV